MGDAPQDAEGLDRRQIAMVRLVKAIEVDVAAKRANPLTPPSRRKTYDRVLAAKAELRAALLEASDV